jgi:hypothetical protein
LFNFLHLISPFSCKKSEERRESNFLASWIC